MYIFVIVCITLPLMTAGYSCVCTSNFGKPIYQTLSLTSSFIGILPRSQCARQVLKIDNKWSQVSFKKQIGFMYINGEPGLLTNCVEQSSTHQYITTAKPGSQSPAIVYSATPQHIQETLAPTFSYFSSQQPAFPTLIEVTTDKPGSESPAIVYSATPQHNQETLAPIFSYFSSHQPAFPTLSEGHLELCPKSLRTHSAMMHGFIGQYGNHCYEFVPALSQYGVAQRRCRTTLSGNLADIADSQEQKYLERLMAGHGQSQPAWIGLKSFDSGGLQWVSGAPIQYTNFAPDISSHHNEPCFVFQPNGQWERTNCGVSLPLFLGLGEKHPSICKYKLTDTPLSILDSAVQLLIGR